MGIFSFLGFYYSLAQARISNAMEHDPRGTKRKYNIIKILWIGLIALAFYLDVNFIAGLLLCLTVAALPLLLSLEGSDQTGRWDSLTSDSERIERKRREKILKNIDPRKSDEDANTTLN